MKLLKICRGLPGSGKSFIAEEIKNACEDEGWCASIFSTDDLFMHNGKYVFNPKMLGVNHKRNYARVHAALMDDVDVVIVDNTNTQFWEMKKYILAAIAMGYDIDIHEPDTEWAWDVEKCAERNSHGVPLESIQKMKDRWEPTVAIQDKIRDIIIALG